MHTKMDCVSCWKYYGAQVNISGQHKTTNLGAVVRVALHSDKYKNQNNHIAGGDRMHDILYRWNKWLSKGSSPTLIRKWSGTTSRSLQECYLCCDLWVMNSFGKVSLNLGLVEIGTAGGRAGPSAASWQLVPRMNLRLE